MWIFEGFIFFGVYWGHSALYQGPFIVLLVIHLSVCGSYSRTKRASWWRFRAEIKGLVHPNYMWFLAMQNNLKLEFYRAQIWIYKMSDNCEECLRLCLNHLFCTHSNPKPRDIKMFQTFSTEKKSHHLRNHCIFLYETVRVNLLYTYFNTH